MVKKFTNVKNFPIHVHELTICWEILCHIISSCTPINFYIWEFLCGSLAHVVLCTNDLCAFFCILKLNFCQNLFQGRMNRMLPPFSFPGQEIYTSPRVCLKEHLELRGSKFSIPKWVTLTPRTCSNENERELRKRWLYYKTVCVFSLSVFVHL